MTGPAGHDPPLDPTKGSPKLEVCKSTLPVAESTDYEVITIDDGEDVTSVIVETEGQPTTIGNQASELEDRPATPTQEPPPATTDTKVDFAALLKNTFNEINKQLIVYEDTKPIEGLQRQEWIAEQTRICELVLARTSEEEVQDPEVFERLKSSVAEALTKSESLRHAKHATRKTMAIIAEKCIIDFLNQIVSWNQQIELDWVTKCKTTTDVLALMEDSVASAMVLEMYSDLSETCKDLYNQFKWKKAEQFFALVQALRTYCDGMKTRCQSSKGRCAEYVVELWHLECLQETKGMKDALEKELKSVWETLVVEAKNKIQDRVQIMLAELRRAEEEKERKKAEEESRGLAKKYQEAMGQKLSAEITFPEVELIKIHHEVKGRVLRDLKGKYELVWADFEEAIGVELDAEWEKIKLAEADKRKKTSEDSKKKKDDSSFNQVKPVLTPIFYPCRRSTSANRSSRRRSRSPETRPNREDRYSSSRRSTRSQRDEDRSGRPRRSRSTDRTSNSRPRDKRSPDSRRSPYDYDRRRRSRSRSPSHRTSRSDDRHYSTSRSRYRDRSRTPPKNIRQRSKSRSKDNSNYRDVKITVDKFGRTSKLEPPSSDPTTTAAAATTTDKKPTPAELYLEWWTPLPTTTVGELQCNRKTDLEKEKEPPESDVETGKLAEKATSKTTSSPAMSVTVELEVEPGPGVPPVAAVKPPATATLLSSPKIAVQVGPSQAQAFEDPSQDIPSSCPSDTDDFSLMERWNKYLQDCDTAKVADQPKELCNHQVQDESIAFPTGTDSLASSRPEKSPDTTNPVQATGMAPLPAVPVSQTCVSPPLQHQQETVPGSSKRPSCTYVQNITTTPTKKIRTIPVEPTKVTPSAAKETLEVVETAESSNTAISIAEPELVNNPPSHQLKVQNSQKTTVVESSEFVHVDLQQAPTDQPSPRTSDFLNMVITETDLILEAFVDGIDTYKTLSRSINLALDPENQVVLPHPDNPGETIDIMYGLVQPDGLSYVFDGGNAITLVFDKVLALYFTLEIIRPLGLKAHHLSTIPVRIAISSTMPSGSRHQLLNGFKIAGFKLGDDNTLVQMTTALALSLRPTKKQIFCVYQRTTSIEAAIVHVTESGCHETKAAKVIDTKNVKAVCALGMVCLKNMIDASKAGEISEIKKFHLIDPAVKSPQPWPSVKKKNWIRLHDPQRVALAGLRKISAFCVSPERKPIDLYKEKSPFSINIINRNIGTLAALVERNQYAIAKCAEVTLKPGQAAHVVACFGGPGERRTTIKQALIEVRASSWRFNDNFPFFKDPCPNQLTIKFTIDSQGLIELHVPDQFKSFVNTKVYYMAEGFEDAVAHVQRILGDSEPQVPVRHEEETEPQVAAAQQSLAPTTEITTTRTTSDFVIKYSPLDPRFYSYRS